MSLFKAKECLECGGKAGFFTGLKLTDGYLCYNCSRELPLYIQNYISSGKTYSYEDVRYFKNWMKESVEQYSEIYTETKRYNEIGIDEIHGLFVLDWYKKGETLIFRFDELIDHKFWFVEKELKEGFMNDKVKGEVIFQVVMGNPYFLYTVCIDKNAKTKVQTSIFGKKTYVNPDYMVEFGMAFVNTSLRFPSKYTSEC